MRKSRLGLTHPVFMEGMRKMPETRTEKLFFLICMSAMMVYGMEVYNHFLLHKTLTISHFLVQPIFILFLLIVMFLETLIVGPIAHHLASRIVKTPKNPRSAIFAMQLCTVCLMCPIMSMVATIVFKGGFSPGLLFIWGQTVVANFVMALLWQLLVAGPLVRFFVIRLPRQTRMKTA